MTNRIWWAAVGIAVALSGAACGNGTAELTPLGPSGSSTPATGSGARITGTVNGGSALALTTGSTTGAGITVTVTGTGISATVDGTGKFTLEGVPAGNVTLQFTGSGINATVTLSAVGQQDQISIAVTINGNSVTIEARQKVGGDKKVEVEGKITSVDATSRTMRVSGAQVSVPATATIRQGSKTLQFADLKVGDKVHVKGVNDGTMLKADEVKLQSEAKQEQLMELEGAVSVLAGTCPSLTFTVKTTKVATDGSTYFKKGTSCAGVRNASMVEVVGRKQADGSLLAVSVAVEEADDDVEVNGLVSKLTGTCPAVTFMVNGTTTVKTNTSTRFLNMQCSALKDGSNVHTHVTKQADGSYLVSEMELRDSKSDDDDDDDDDDEDELKFEGIVASLAGTCPALTFSVKSTAFVTNSSTRFKDVSCSAVKDGMQVEVRATKQANGPMLVTRVEVDD